MARFFMHNHLRINNFIKCIFLTLTEFPAQDMQLPFAEFADINIAFEQKYDSQIYQPYEVPVRTI